MVRNDKFKMAVNTVTREPLELYDMEQDPRELRNLIEDSAYDQVIRTYGWVSEGLARPSRPIQGKNISRYTGGGSTSRGLEELAF